MAPRAIGGRTLLERSRSRAGLLTVLTLTLAVSGICLFPAIRPLLPMSSDGLFETPLQAADGSDQGTYLLTAVPEASTDQSEAARHAKEELEKRAAREKVLHDTIQPYLTRHCVDCHSKDSPEGGINVESLTSIDQFLSERDRWERVYRMINAGAMPPSDYDPLPSPKDQQRIAELLHEELFNFDCDDVYNPGRPTVQRLNRAEYNNTVQDLFGISIEPANDFPADDVGEGFDNIGDVLSLPPLLMEKYLNAAEQVAEAVIDTTDYSKPRTLTLNADQLKSSRGGRASGTYLWLATNGQISGTFDLGATGEYELIINAQAQQMGDEKARFALSVDDKRLEELQVISNRKPEEFARQITVTKPRVRITAAFLNDAYDGEKKQDRNFAVGSIRLRGPMANGQPIRSEVHKRLITAVPDAEVSVHAAAVRVLQPLLRRAFRRPVSEAEVNRYAGLVDQAVTEMGETYEGGISLAVQAILVAPDFLFRPEQDPAPGQSERLLNDFELASRLSYFLWSSMPDEQLLQLAEAGQLNDSEVLRQQVHRMLKDEKAEALVQNFAAQWLNLRNLDDVQPNPDVFGKFDKDLKHDMRTETELLFKTVMQEDRSVEDLLSADFTFVNERLAAHYGLEGIEGDEFQRVSLNGSNRSGVLTHASILTLTSNPGRTSPVKRGKWIMENIFGEAPPPPPPNVPELEETAKVAPDASLREQLAKHREDPGCAACHKVMDPLGLGLENFNAIGQWREQDDGKPVDASGVLPSGESFNGPLQLIGVIQTRKDKFFRTLADRMLIYAVGRGTEYYDKCAVDQCLKLLAERQNHFSALVEGIVLSDPFRKRAAPAPPNIAR
ncbi:MAG: DUF1592 domain-containing protein [Fuerstiella sp.]